MSGTDSAQAHTIHRMEAFSDIVIGFCLAEIGVSSLPATFGSANAVWLSVFVFAMSFFLIVVLWWLHHRLFTTYFVLSSPMLVMNFVMLGGLALLVYFMQAALHAQHEARLLLELWFASFALVYAMLCAMYVTGLRARWKALTRPQIEWGLRRCINVGVAAAIFLAIAAMTAVYAGTSFGPTIAVLVGVSVLINRIAAPLVVRRVVRSLPTCAGEG